MEAKRTTPHIHRGHHNDQTCNILTVLLSFLFFIFAGFILSAQPLHNAEAPTGGDIIFNNSISPPSSDIHNGEFESFEDNDTVPCSGEVVYREDLKESSIIQKAYEMSGCDKNFVYTLDCENDKWTTDRRHEHSAKINSVGIDWGLCGINDYWHPEVVNNKEFTNPDYQLEKCLYFYKTNQLSCTKKPSQLRRSKDRLVFVEN